MLLEIRNPGVTQSAMTILDTLPQGWRVERGSMCGIKGIDSVWVVGNVLSAKCSGKDTLMQVIFNLERVSGTEDRSSAVNTFAVVRNDGTAQTVIERAHPIFLGSKQKEQK
jgi:hypothetical protein